MQVGFQNQFISHRQRMTLVTPMLLHCKSSLFLPRFSRQSWSSVVGRPPWFSNRKHACLKSLFPAPRRNSSQNWEIGCQAEDDGNEMYPFDDKSYKRVHLAFVVQNENDGRSSPNTGSLVLMERELSESLQTDIMAGDVRGLPIHVGGDILVGISYAAAGKSPERPLTSDLLLQFMKKYLGERGKDEELLMVAITDFRNETYFGRLFIGDSLSKEVHQDIDCRPSDGVWLAIKTGCPLFVSSKIWEACALPVGVALNNDSEDEDETPDHKPINPLTSILPGDIEVIQRLKREMSVALAEEDYTTAARLRDHPYMKKYKAIVECMEDGRIEDAETMKQELEQEVQDNENKGNWENEDSL